MGLSRSGLNEGIIHLKSSFLYEKVISNAFNVSSKLSEQFYFFITEGSCLLYIRNLILCNFHFHLGISPPEIILQGNQHDLMLSFYRPNR